MENNNPFKILGTEIKTNVPHIVVGSNGLSIDKSQTSPINPIQQDLFNTKEQEIISKLKKWWLIIAVTLVICYAGLSCDHSIE